MDKMKADTLKSVSQLEREDSNTVPTDSYQFIL